MRQRAIAHALALSCGLAAVLVPGPAVRGQGGAPLAHEDGAYVVVQGGTLSAAAPGVLANDDGGGAPLTALLSRAPAHGTLSLSPDGSFTYAHDGGAATADSFGYRASDGVLASAETTATLAVTAAVGATLEVPADHPTVQDALDAADPGDLILIAPGTYEESLELTKAVTLASWFLTTGDPSYIDTTILDGDDRAAVIELPSGAEDGASIVGLTLQNAEDGIMARAKFHLLRSRVRWTKDGIDYEDGSGGTVRYCVFEENDDDGIDPDGDVDVVIEHNLIRNNGGDGIEVRLQPYTGPTLYYVIRHNRIHGNQEDGIQLIDYDEPTDRHFEISYNAIHDNVQAGLGMMSGANTQENYEGASIVERILVIGNTFSNNNHGMTGGDNAVVLNNVFVGHPVLAVKNVDGASELAYNLFHDNGQVSSGSNLDPGTTYAGDPLLDPELSLLAGSPAIDAGTSSYVFQGDTVLDLDATAYEGSAPDLGAFEWVPGSSTGPDAPDLLAPADGAADLALTPLLRWQGSADDWQIQIATSWDFLGSQTVYDVSAGPALEHSVPAGVLDHARAYFWRVRGTEAEAIGAWSQVRSFTTGAPTGPPAAPTLSTPLPGVAGVDLEPTLAWTGAADLFHVEVATDSTFASPVLEASTAGKSLVPGAGVLAHATTYHWRVRGENVFGTSSWSADFTFTTLPPPPPLQPPFALTSPFQDLSSIDLRWQEPSDPRVTAYAIYRDGVKIATESEPDHLAVGLDEDTLYLFEVASIDVDGAESLRSSPLGVVTARAPPTISLAIPVGHDSDDAEQRDSGSQAVTLSSGDLELVEDGSKNQIVGVRFRDVDVPGDVPILGARIQFTASASDGANTELLVEGEAADDADVFRSTRSDLGDRATTDASVPWDPPAWSHGDAGADERTPELTAVVQEIVDRPGWSPGNAMAFLISGSGLRIAHAHDGDPDAAAVLEIEYLGLCTADADGDGYSCELDCDDGDPDVHPDADEVCDGRDNDCDRLVDENDASDASVWYADADGDGYGDPDTTTVACIQPPGWLADTSDCNDADAGAWPGAGEACNGRDDDCDGAVDEGYVPQATVCGVGACGSTGVTSCVDGAVVDSCEPAPPAPDDASCNGTDDDCDGFVDEEYPQVACSTGQPGVCDPGTTRCQAGAVSCLPDTFPAADDASCNGLDDDCDGGVDEDFAPEVVTCGVGACEATGTTVCADGEPASSCKEGKPALSDASCDGVDDDCDGIADEDFAPASCATGLPGVCAAGTTLCQGGGETCQPDVLPQPEICDDGIDNDCDGAIDAADGDSCGGAVLSIPIVAGADDVEERISSGGSMAMGSSSLQLVEDGSLEQAVGLRFRDVDVPRGATIVSARIQFDADESDVGSVDLVIEAEASDDAAAFERVDGNVTDRPRTGASVAWNPPAWTSSEGSGPEQRTPDLAALVQEVVDRPGWTQGNALAFILTGSGTRTARSYDGTPSRAAVLEIEYGEGGSGCTADADGDGYACEVDCDDADPAVHPGAPDLCNGADDDCDGGVDEDFAPQSCATGQPGLCAAGTTSCQAGTPLCEPDQGPQPEICDDGLDNDCDGATDQADAGSCGSLTQSIPIVAGDDDVEERISSGGSMSMGSSSLELVEAGSVDHAVGLRFRGVAIPQGASVTSARIQFSSDEIDSGSVDLVLRAEASDDALPFERVDGNVTDRPLTGAAVPWSPPAWTSTQASGPDQLTPELAALVQEVVDRPGWSEGGAIVFVLTGSGTRTARSYDGTPARAAVLELEYGPGGGGCAADADGDGYPCEIDCDDADPAVHPGAPDLCNGADDDCDGITDEDFAPQSCSTGQPGICAAGTTTCDAGAELCEADQQPEAEICDDGLDNDCDGDTDLADAGSCAPSQLSVPISAGHDDVEERISSGGSMSMGSSSLQLAEDGSLEQAVGLRFRDVALPQGATILGARVQFWSDEADGGAASLVIEGEAADDAPAFERVDDNVTDRPRTSASVAWSPPAWTSSQASGPDQRSPELTAIVQEIVDRPGWSDGNALVLIVTGSGTRTARSYDGTPARAATLEVEFLAAP